MQLVLASTSPHRRALLQQLGVPFVAVDPMLDEEPYKRTGVSPEELVVALAEAKANAVRSRFPQALIVGSDQCAELDGRILGKPGSLEATVDQLVSLSGRTHRLLTGLCVLNAGAGSSRTHLDIHCMTMRRLGRHQLERYASADRPFDCAGGYRIESRGVALFEAVDGQDQTAVVGLPLMQLAILLAQEGLDVLTHQDGS